MEKNKLPNDFTVKSLFDESDFNDSINLTEETFVNNFTDLTEKQIEEEYENLYKKIKGNKYNKLKDYEDFLFNDKDFEETIEDVDKNNHQFYEGNNIKNNNNNNNNLSNIIKKITNTKMITFDYLKFYYSNEEDFYKNYLYDIFFNYITFETDKNNFHKYKDEISINEVYNFIHVKPQNSKNFTNYYNYLLEELQANSVDLRKLFINFFRLNTTITNHVAKLDYSDYTIDTSKNTSFFNLFLDEVKLIKGLLNIFEMDEIDEPIEVFEPVKNNLIDKRGFDKYGINKNTGTIYDENGYDKNGFNKDNKHIITNNIYDEEGYDKWGRDKDGADKSFYERYKITKKK